MALTKIGWKRALYIGAAAVGAVAAIVPGGAVIGVPILGAVSVKAGLGALATFLAGLGTKTPGKRPPAKPAELGAGQFPAVR
jgi:hypothetical protein